MRKLVHSRGTILTAGRVDLRDVPDVLSKDHGKTAVKKTLVRQKFI